MEFASHLDSPAVLILKSDRLYARSLQQMVLSVLPNARFTLATCIDAAVASLVARPFELIVAGLESSMKGDVLDFIASRKLAGAGTERIFVVSSDFEQRVVAALRTLAVSGVFDTANELPTGFASALQTVMAGQRYWSPSVLERMRNEYAASSSLFRRLTTAEQLILAVVGDGSDDVSAARELGLSPATISTVRRELHRKLGVQHRGALIRIAAECGFVRFTQSGVVRPGFGMLTASYQACRGRRAPDDAQQAGPLHLR